MAKSFPARLHVLLAARAPVGVILRRRPANSVCSILWDRETDTFQLGQWLRGRIYERRADISPDGRHMIYFARNGRWPSETKGTWTAISRVPWLKAVVLYGKGDCWNGGGLFTSNTAYWLNGCHFLLRDSQEVRLDEHYQPAASYGGECPGVYYLRLQRDGWLLTTVLDGGGWTKCTVFEKSLPNGWILRKFAHADVDHPQGTGCYWDEHEIEHPTLERRLSFPKWEWADWDGQALVWAEKGCLHRATLYSKDLGDAKILFDANGMKFEARAAPY